MHSPTTTPSPPPDLPPGARPDPDALAERLEALRRGDPVALSALAGALYDELRLIARGQRRRLRASDTLHTTALVHEAYAKLSRRSEPLELVDRGHFFRVASRVMRDVLVDYARARATAKRGSGRASVPLGPDATIDAAAAVTVDLDTVLSVHDALGRLESFDREAARVVELRYFGGLDNAQVGEALACSTATVKRRWTCARAWLRRELAEVPQTLSPVIGLAA